jgi:hypothetical protein
MIQECRRCVRCREELDIFGFYREAFYFEEELLGEGIFCKDGDDICDECANEIIMEETL